MKFTQVLLFTIMASSAHAFGDSSSRFGGDFFFGFDDSGSSSPPPPPPEPEAAVVTKTYYVHGGVDDFCLDTKSICDLQVYGDLSWIFCRAAQKALSRARVGWAVQATAEIAPGQDGNIKRIQLNAQAKSGVVVSTFLGSVADSQSKTDTYAKVLTESDTNGGDVVYAASLALGESRGRSVAVSRASALNNAETNSKTFSINNVVARGNAINTFQGAVSGLVGLFSQVDTAASAVTHAKAASQAFSVAVSEAIKDWPNKDIIDLNTAGARAKTQAVSDAFGKSFAKSLSQLVVQYAIPLIIERDEWNDTYAVKFALGSKSLAGARCAGRV